MSCRIGSLHDAHNSPIHTLDSLCRAINAEHMLAIDSAHKLAGTVRSACTSAKACQQTCARACHGHVVHNEQPHGGSTTLTLARRGGWRFGAACTSGGAPPGVACRASIAKHRFGHHIPVLQMCWPCQCEKHTHETGSQSALYMALFMAHFQRMGMMQCVHATFLPSVPHSEVPSTGSA